MKWMRLIIAGLFLFSCVAISGTATADLRSETKKAQDRAYELGKKRAEGYYQGKDGSPRDDGYANMTEDEKDAYKQGYVDAQKEHD